MIAEFNSEELAVIEQSLKERFGKAVETSDVETQLRLNPPSPELSTCAGVYWHADDCHFVVSKTGDSQYHSLFFYTEDEQFGTGKTFYDDIMDCVLTLLRAQADHHLQSKGL